MDKASTDLRLEEEFKRNYLSNLRLIEKHRAKDKEMIDQLKLYADNDFEMLNLDREDLIAALKSLDCEIDLLDQFII